MPLPFLLRDLQVVELLLAFSEGRAVLGDVVLIGLGLLDDEQVLGGHFLPEAHSQHVLGDRPESNSGIVCSRRVDRGCSGGQIIGQMRFIVRVGVGIGLVTTRK